VRLNFLLAFLTSFKNGLIQDELFRLASIGVSTFDSELRQGDYKLPDWPRKFIMLDGQDSTIKRT